MTITTHIPTIGDAVNFDGKQGVIISMSNQDGLVDDPEDAIAITIRWDDGKFSSVLVSDLEFTDYQ